METTQSLKEQRIQNLVDATSFRKPKKIPVGAEILTWPFSYAGVRYEDIADDPEQTAKAYVKYLDDLELDFMWGDPIPVPIKAYHLLGNNIYKFGPDGSTLVHSQPDIRYMPTEDYPRFIENPKAYFDNIVNDRFMELGLSRDQAYARVIEALKEMEKWVTATELIKKYIYEDHAVVPLTGAPFFLMSPLSMMLDKYRGMRDTLLDLRRRPELLRQACDKLLEGVKAMAAQFDPKDFTEPWPFGGAVYHSECFLSPAQFDEFFFNHFRDIYGPFMEAGLKFFIKGEGSFISTIDRYRQLPKGSVIFMLDEDDPFEVHKAIGDWQTVACGITADLLQLGTKEQCVDYVKKCFDTFAPKGGFIFMQNKPLLSAGDAKIENLLAAYQTAHELSRQC